MKELKVTKPSDIVERMLFELETYGWTKGAYYNTEGRCIQGARQHVMDTMPEWATGVRFHGSTFLTLKTIEEAIEECAKDGTIPEETLVYGITIPAFNDSMFTEFHHVRSVLKRAHDMLVEKGQ